MGRPLRIDSADVLYHVTSRGNDGQAVDWLDYETILSEFRRSRGGERRAYREFVEGREARGTPSPFDALVDGFLLGG